MTLDLLRRSLADALSDDRLNVLADYPGAPERVWDAPFAVLGLKSLELRALGFGDPTARRGLFTFTLTAYARSGDAAAAALANLTARAQSESVRALLSSVRFSAAEARPARDGLLRAETELSGDALVAITEVGDAEVITLDFSATVVEI